MKKNILDQIRKTNSWHSNKKFRFSVKPRGTYTEKAIKENRLINIFTGARRVGKTYILYSVINRLLDKKVQPKRILYITGEAREVKRASLRDYVSVYLHDNNFDYQDKLYIFIDEVQEIPSWQQDLKYFYDTTKIKFYLTGSSGVILNKETYKLTGRFIRTNVFPLSFLEYLDFTNQKLYKRRASANRKLFEEYLKNGGYPEYVLNKEPDYLRQVISSTLYRDLLSYYGIRNPAFLQDLLNYLVDKVGNPVSTGRIEKDLKVDRKTAKFYLKYLADVFLIYPVYKKGSSYRITKASNPKYYLNDPGIISLLALSPKIGSLAENAVYLKLLRDAKWLQNPQIFYNDVDGQEIDFFTEERNIEVKYRSNYEQIDFSGYNSLVENLEVIVPEERKRVQEKYPNIRFTEAWRFLT